MTTMMLALMLVVADDPGAARDHFQRGKRHYNTGEFATALVEFKKAYMAAPDPQLLYNLGQCHRKLGHVDEAEDAYRRFLAEAPEDSPDRARAVRHLATLVDARRRRAPPRLRPHVVVMQDPFKEPSRAPEAPPSPVYKRWWFWGAIATVAAASALLLARPSSPDPVAGNLDPGVVVLR